MQSLAADQAPIGGPKSQTSQRHAHRGTLAYLLLISVTLWCALSNAFVGYPATLPHPRNFQGMLCGWDEPVRKLPYLYVPLNPHGGNPRSPQLYPERSLCVAACPSAQDVAAKRTVMIPENAVIRDTKKQTYVSILHQLRSPVYASAPLGGSLCVPDHDQLQAQLVGVLDYVDYGSFRMAAAAIYLGLPVLLGVGSVCVLASFLLSRSVRVLHGTVTMGLLAAGVFGSGSFGIRYFGLFNSASQRHSAFTPTSDAMLLLLGTGNLVTCVIIMIFGYLHFIRLGRAEHLVMAINKVMPSSRAIAGISLLAQAVTVTVAVAGLAGFLGLAAQTPLFSEPYKAALDPNGGIYIIGLGRSLGFPPLARLKALVILLVIIWGFEFIQSVAKCTAVAMTHEWYFYRRNYGRTFDIDKNNWVATLGRVTASCFGALADLSVTRMLTRIVRLWTSRPGSDIPDTWEHNPIIRLNGEIQNPVFLELLEGKSVTEARRGVIDQLTDPYRATLHRTHGLLSIRTWVVGLAIGVWSFNVSFDLMLRIATSLNDPVRFPLPGAVVSAMVITYISLLPWVVEEAAMDTLVYEGSIDIDNGYIADQSVPGTGDEHYLVCPEQLRLVLENVR